MTGEQATIVFRKLQPDGTFVRQDHPVKIRDGTKPLWTQHSKYDIAVLAMEIPPGMSLTPIELDSLADETALKESGMHIGSDLLILGYPFASKPMARFSHRPPWIDRGISALAGADERVSDGRFHDFRRRQRRPGFHCRPPPKGKGEHARPLVLGIVIAQFERMRKSIPFTKRKPCIIRSTSRRSFRPRLCGRRLS